MKLTKKESIFFVGILFICPWAIKFSLILHDHVRKTQEIYAKEGRTYASYSDFNLAILSTFLFCVSRFICEKLFLPIGEYVIPHKDKWTEKERGVRVVRFSSVLFKGIWFIFCTTYLWFTIIKQDWTPFILGGSGETIKCWGQPFDNIPKAVLNYYMIELGYHTHSLIFHVFFIPHRNDFLEMVLHHLVTLFLISFSYLSNFVRIGTLVLFVHDVADVFVYLTKTFVDTKSTFLTLTSYTGMLISWFFARLVVFPFYVIYSSFYESYEIEMKNKYFPNGSFAVFHSILNVMLIMLIFLHVYWYGLFLRMGFHFLKVGQTVDIINKVGKDGELKKDKKKIN